jgi:3',5'-cyclic AMP phosphodiesterase CpdA
MAFVLAHLSDPHLAPLPRPALRDLASKRALGYLNWRRGRGDVHRPEALGAIVDDLAAQAPDHIAVTGDLTNLALDAEFAAAASWLAELGEPGRVSVVPGHHDADVVGALERGLELWGPYAAGDDGAAPGAEDFPVLRRRGRVALVGVSTAIATRPFMATGRVGGRQLARLADELVALSREGVFRVVLLHHPLVVTRRHWAKRLLDAGATRTVLTAAGAELVLHGHLHTPSLATIPGPHGAIPVVGVPSASAASGRARHPAAYALYRIEPDPDGLGWSVELERRGLVGGRVETLDRHALRVSRSPA